MAGGRPQAEIDWKLVESLCKLQCTQEEMASVVGHCVDTLEKHCKIEHGISFSEFFRQKRLGGKASLRRNQWKMSETNPTMAIWLGKQYLGQTDKNDIAVTASEIKINIDKQDDKL